MRYVLITALLCVGCSSSSFVGPTPPPAPQAGVPARLDLTAAPGQGPDGGKAQINGRVTDGLGTPIRNTSIRFTVSRGTLSASEVTVDANGSASTLLIGDPGAVTVGAQSGELAAQVLVAIQPKLVNDPPIPQPPTPLPPVPDPAPLPLSVRISASNETVGTATTLTATAVNGRPPAVYVWSFGDGGTVTTSEAQTTHLYGSAGTFTASATVTDALGRTATGSGIAIVAPPATPPAQGLTGSVNCVPAAHGSVTACTITGLQYNGVTMPGSSISTAFWDFGDGNTATTHFTVAASRAYALAGTYPVIVEVDVATADGIKKGRFVTSVIVP